jgi:transcription elongation factor GreA
MVTKFKLTEERLKQLKDELLYLQTVREKEVAELIKEARSFGDLSENSEYDEAKTEQGKLYSKIAELQNIIENAEIIDFNTVGDTISLAQRSRFKRWARI